MEMRFGDWEGLTVAEVTERFPDEYRQWAEAPHLVARPGGETLADVRQRALAGLDELRETYDGKTVCLVAHGVTARVLILEALGLGLERLWSFEVSPTGISELEFRGDWTALHRMNTRARSSRRSCPRGRRSTCPTRPRESASWRSACSACSGAGGIGSS
jgi:probable phosphoglycerate mutase